MVLAQKSAHPEGEESIFSESIISNRVEVDTYDGKIFVEWDPNTAVITLAQLPFTNQGSRMDYVEYRSKDLPIGSGVTEAACKTLIKQRLCRSGMRWKDKGASIVLSFRYLVQSKRWGQFWHKINQYGIPVIA